MRVLRHDDPVFAAALRSLNRRATPAPHVAEAVAEVRATGDAALWALGARVPSSPDDFSGALRYLYRYELP